MTIIYPREFPEGIYLRTLSLKPVQPIKRSSLQSGSVDAIGQPGSYWLGSWQTNFLTGAQIGEMSAWINSMKGGALKFMARDPQRLKTYLHDDFSAFTLGGLVFEGATVASAVPALNEVTVSLPAGFHIAAGDRFEIVQGDWHKLVEVDVPLTVSSEGSYTLGFNPPLPVGVFSAGAVINFSSPGIPMSFTEVSDPENSGASQRFSFSGRGN